MIRILQATGNQNAGIGRHRSVTAGKLFMRKARMKSECEARRLFENAQPVREMISSSPFIYPDLTFHPIDLMADLGEDLVYLMQNSILFIEVGKPVPVLILT